MKVKKRKFFFADFIIFMIKSFKINKNLNFIEEVYKFRLI